MQFCSRVLPPSGIANLMLVLGTVTVAMGQSAPSFRSSAQLQLMDANASETLPPPGKPVELFGSVPTPGNVVPGMPKLPRVTPQLPATVQPLPRPGAAMRVPGIRDLGFRIGASGKPPETPVALQRHPGRNLALRDGDAAFTFRSTNYADVLTQVSLGLETDTWHTDNLTNAPRSRAIGENIMELRPVVQLNLGSPATTKAADALRSEYYLQFRYSPTQQTLFDAGTSRMLQRLKGEIGRASPVLLSAVRFEYDENIFAVRGDGTVEDTSTVTEVSPVIEYSFSAKTAFRVEGSWRRIVAQTSANNRSEYVLDVGIATAITPKTTMGVGSEFGHIPFDQAQFGAQDYQQGYASMIWHASPTLFFQIRAGIEMREFDRPVPKPARVTPVASMILNWSPNENTQVNAGFRVQNQPSVSKAGATFQEIRFGTDGRYRMGRNFYVSGEVALIQRNYDSGIRELETGVRPALGFHSERSRLFDIMNAEIYYQFRRVDSNQPAADRDRNLFGFRTTLYF